MYLKKKNNYFHVLTVVSPFGPLLGGENPKLILVVTKEAGGHFIVHSKFRDLQRLIEFNNFIKIQILDPI